jgi:hypothetical protein
MMKTFTIEEFYAWIWPKDENERFEYTDNKNCPIAQFVRDRGVFETPHASTDFVYKSSDDAEEHIFNGADVERIEIPDGLDSLIRHVGIHHEDDIRTFGRLKDDIESHLRRVPA